jgi:hypothetical protein
LAEKRTGEARSKRMRAHTGADLERPSVGIGPLGSHGCSATASVTFHVPRSITPSAASMTL